MTRIRHLRSLSAILLLIVQLILLGTGFAGCARLNSTPLPRDELAAHLAPLLKVERRADQVKHYALLLNKLWGMGEESAAALKKHHDVYYVYYLAANLHLARGNIHSYLAHLKLAEVELDGMEMILKKSFATLTPD